jgi:Zn-dependent protease with chaperone function
MHMAARSGDQSIPAVSPPVLAALTGWRALDRRLYRFGARRAARSFAASEAEPADLAAVPRRGLAGVLLSLLGVAGYLAWIAGAVLLAWWCALDFPSFRLIVGGAPLIVVIALWPRFDRLDRYATVLSRATAPTLFQLVDRVAATVGAPVPDVIAVDGRLAADAGRQGLRSRRTLLLGMPLWLALDEAQRAALLAHLLGHFIDRDPRRGALGPIEYSLYRAVTVLQPTRSRMLDPMRDPDTIAARVGGSGQGVTVTPPPQGLLVVASELIWTPIGKVLGGGVMMVRLALVAAAQPMSYHAAYFADALGARVGGTAAMTGVIHLLTRGEGLLTRFAAHIRAGGDPGGWQRIAADEFAPAGDSAPPPAGLASGQSPFAQHPPADLRIRMLAARPPHLTSQESLDTHTQIDEELHSYARRAALDLTGR